MKPLRLYWWDASRVIAKTPRVALHNLSHFARNRSIVPFRNFGDELSPLIVRSLTERPVVWADPNDCEMLAVGSIVHMITPRNPDILIWGAGVRNPSIKAFPKQENVLALRGPKSALALALDPASQTYGDPGLFAKTLISFRTKTARKITFIPHFSEEHSLRGLNNIRLMRGIANNIVSPSLNPLEVLGEIASSQIVYSSSLHGLVCSISLGIPTVWIDPGASSETQFKFEDFFESIQYTPHQLKTSGMSSESSRLMAVEAANNRPEELTKRIETLTSELAAALASSGVCRG